MADAKITALTEDTAPSLEDLIATVNDPGGSPANRKVTLANLLKILTPPQGFLINGKIVPSVTSSDLTVAIKGLDGNDPSATNPVYVRIGDTVRAITAALSVTKNDGTNWFAAGGGGEKNYFVYLGYNATDGVVIGFSLLQYATQYGDFSATTTNASYAAISTITTAASTDYYEQIGMFAATLGASATYLWTVPTFTARNLIQRPVQEYRRLLAVVQTPLGSSWTHANNTNEEEVTGLTVTLPIINKKCMVMIRFTGWYTVGAANNTLRIRAGTNATKLSNTERNNLYVGSAKTIENANLNIDVEMDLSTQSYVVISGQPDANPTAMALSSSGNRTLLMIEIYG